MPLSTIILLSSLKHTGITTSHILGEPAYMAEAHWDSALLSISPYITTVWVPITGMITTTDGTILTMAARGTGVTTHFTTAVTHRSISMLISAPDGDTTTGMDTASGIMTTGRFTKLQIIIITIITQTGIHTDPCLIATGVANTTDPQAVHQGVNRCLQLHLQEPNLVPTLLQGRRLTADLSQTGAQQLHHLKEVVTRYRREEAHQADQKTEPRVSHPDPDLPPHQNHPPNLLQEQDPATARIAVPGDKH